jgi:hypothetical protein
MLENDFSHAKDPDDGREFVSSVELSARTSSHTPFDVFGQVKIRVYVLGCNRDRRNLGRQVSVKLSS